MHITRQTYEEYFLLYNDGELNAGEKKAVEDFIYVNPDLRDELVMLQQLTFIPDDSVTFENKETLYREEERKVVPFAWWKVAVAAILLISFGIFGWLYLDEKQTVTIPAVASKEPVAAPEKLNSLQTVEPSVAVTIQQHP